MGKFRPTHRVKLGDGHWHSVVLDKENTHTAYVIFENGRRAKIHKAKCQLCTLETPYEFVSPDDGPSPQVET